MLEYNALLYIILSILIVSAISVVGIIFIRNIAKHLFFMVSFSVGAILGVTFLELLPETKNFSIVLMGILAFFVLEKILFWHHHHHYGEHHHKQCKVHSYVYLNLIGDGFHNFIDGMVIASSYLISLPLGLSVTAAIAFHEIPQEIGDFGILLAGGLSKTQALVYNLISALTALVGGLLVYLFSFKAELAAPHILSFAAGGFLYIATADLIPELHKERNFKNSLKQIFFILLGIAVIWFSITYVHE